MRFQNDKEKILIIDFGSQVTKLIARRIRDLGIYSEVIIPKEVKKYRNYNSVKGIILSGGPSTVTKNKFQSINLESGLANYGHKNVMYIKDPNLLAFESVPFRLYRYVLK